MSQAGLAAAALVCLMTVLSPAIEGYLHLASAIPVILLGVLVGFSLFTLVPQGVLLGQLRFRVVALSLVAGTFVRLATGIVLTELGFGLDGALEASVLAACVMLGILLWPLRHEVWSSSGDTLVMQFRSAALAVAALGGFAALVGVDSFLARHYLSGQASGHYVAASTAARIALFLPGAIALIAFPKFAASRGTGVEARHVLVTSLLAVAGLGAVAAAVMFLAPHLLISILFGAKYQEAAGALRILSVPAAGLGLISVLVYFHLARHSRQSLVCWVGVALAAVLISLFHASPTAIAWSMFFVTGITFALLGIGALHNPALRTDELIGGEAPLQREEADIDLSIVVPYFNPGTRLRSTVDEIVVVLTELGISFEIITVSDGSTDHSEDALDGLSRELVHSVRLTSNQGKGQALRVGLAMGRGKYLGFIDADGDLPASQLVPFVSLVKSHHPDVVLGSKRHPMSEVVYPPLRRVYSWGYQLLIRALFRLKIRDTQTGLKLIRREVLVEVLPLMLEKRFAFDLELLVVARRLGYRRFFEAPIQIKERFGSTISVQTVWRMLIDTVAIFYRLRLIRYYDRTHDLSLVEPPIKVAAQAQAAGHAPRAASSGSDAGRPLVDAYLPTRRVS